MGTSHLVWLLIAIGSFCVIIDMLRLNRTCPPAKTVYKYIPRSFDQEQDNPLRPSQVFGKMFTAPDPWISGVGVDTTKPRRSYNEFWISQE